MMSHEQKQTTSKQRRQPQKMTQHRRHPAETLPPAPWFAPRPHGSEPFASTGRRASRPADAAPLYAPSSTRRVRQALARVGRLPRQRLLLVLPLLLLLLLLLLTLCEPLQQVPNRHRSCAPTLSASSETTEILFVAREQCAFCKLNQT